MDIKDILRTSKIFSSLDAEALAQVAEKFIPVELKPSEVLFYQGEPSDSVYLVVSGKLSATFTDVSAQSRLIGYIEPGEIVGELGVIVNELRALTIKALRDTFLLKLSTNDFVEICLQYPAIMFAALHPIVVRSKNMIQMLSAEKINKHIVIVPANKNTNIKDFSDQLLAYGEKFPNVLFISDYSPDFNGKFEDTQSANEKIKHLIKNKKHAHKIIYLLSSYDTPVARVAFKHADTVYIVGVGGETPKIDQHVLEKIESRKLYLLSNPSLILIHHRDHVVHRNTAHWIEQIEFGLHHHVRMSNAKDFYRLLRFLRGKAVGVVLSGGGTRGWAHLGVIKALRKAKIPIDIIGGTSAGAVVAACYAIPQTYEGAYDNFHKIVTGSKNSVSWRSLTWPVISLFNAKWFTESQIDTFKQVQIEDLWLPYFCISCNLTKNMEEIHRSGILWEKTRASASIPGLVPPMLIKGELHLDGGLVNNLPVDVMRQFIGPKGRIIAVELNNFAPQDSKYFFPPILTIKDVLLSKLGLSKYQYKFPRFLDVFLRGLFTSSAAKTRQNSLAANMFVNLNLSHFRFLNSHLHRTDSIIDIGYQEAWRQINEIRNKKDKNNKMDKGKVT